MTNSEPMDLFPPFPFESRTVPTVDSAQFDFEQWKRVPSGPFVLKGLLAEWPLFQALQRSATEDERLDYLVSNFGDADIAYTRVPASDPFMGFDDSGRQNFEYAPSDCKLRDFCSMMRPALKDPKADILYARGGANSVRTWKGFPESIRPLPMLRGMTPNGEGVWLGTGRHISYIHQDAHFNFLIMLAGVKRVLLYPLQAIGDLYPTPYYGGIAGTTSSFVRPRAPDLERFPRFVNAAKDAQVAVLNEGDVLCLPPCWWHYVEAAPGLNLMINTFVWALPPVRVREFDIMMRESIGIALGLSPQQRTEVRRRLYGQARPANEPELAAPAQALLQRLSRFLRADVPEYWQEVARCFYDHYVFQLNGPPVPTYPERHEAWLRQQSTLKTRARNWLRFNRDLMRVGWQRRRATGVVP